MENSFFSQMNKSFHLVLFCSPKVLSRNREWLYSCCFLYQSLALGLEWKFFKFTPNDWFGVRLWEKLEAVSIPWHSLLFLPHRWLETPKDNREKPDESLILHIVISAKVQQRRGRVPSARRAGVGGSIVHRQQTRSARLQVVTHRRAASPLWRTMSYCCWL